MHFFIVTPSYNQAQFIKQTIDSVLSQRGSFTVEYWVIDGQSTDKTIAILKKYNARISWITEADKGQSDALNKGINKLFKTSPQKLKDTIFAYINSDDYYLPDAFHKVQQVLTTNPEAMWCFGDCLIIDEHNHKTHSLVYWYRWLLNKIFQPWFLYILNPIPQPATFIRASALKKTGLFSVQQRLVMDYEYWHKLLKQYGSPIVVPQALAAFRIHSLSKGGQQFKKQFADQYQVAQNYTTNPIFLGLHKLHNYLIILVYSVIK